MNQNETAKLLLPSTPPALCFNKEHFTKDDFNVDHFVVECRRHVSLEIMRNDLHVYLKILQNAMIELINKDYADFLNLSTNLVGMDKSINHLIQPLNHIKKGISELNESAKEKLKGIEDKLKAKAAIRDKKERLKKMLKMIKTLEHIQQLHTLPTNQLPLDTSTNHNPPNGAREGMSKCQLMERLAGQLNTLQGHLTNTPHSSLASIVSQKVEEMMKNLCLSLHASIIEAYLGNNKTELLILLRSYATIGRVQEAEKIFQEQVVREYMHEVIRESVLEDKGLEGMFQLVLLFVPKHCGLVKQLTSGGEDSVSGYDMLVNGVWCEVVNNIHFNTPSIFAPGNPDVFHQRYTTSMKFVSSFERCLTSVASVKRLRCHPSYTSFKAKWGLSIYFQIRFQEIAGQLETCLLQPFERNQLVSTGVDGKEDGDVEKTLVKDLHRFKLRPSVSLCECLSLCWSCHIFLDVLLHRFWKLSLQLCARYGMWLRELSSDLSAHSSLQKSMPRNDSSFILTHHKKPSDPILSDFNNNTTKNNTTNDNTVALSNGGKETHDRSHLNINNCLSCLCDIRRLISTMEKIFENEILPIIKKRKGIDLKIIKEAWKQGGSSLEEHIPTLTSFISCHLSTLCLNHLKAVNNIPRLYKRTNREAPTKASAYIASLMAPVNDFVLEHRSSLHPSDLQTILVTVVCNVSEQYQSIIVEVLTSLRRMEESLKRLKAARHNNTTNKHQASSDDDKIKLQLCIDVNHFVQQVSSLGVNKSDLNATLEKLKQVVVTDT